MAGPACALAQRAYEVVESKLLSMYFKKHQINVAGNNAALASSTSSIRSCNLMHACTNIGHSSQSWVSLLGFFATQVPKYRAADSWGSGVDSGKSMSSMP